MDKNPFSLYDFLGYLFPGLLTMLIIIHIKNINGTTDVEDYISISKFMNTFKNGIKLEWWKSTMILIIISYILGHIIAYLSSVSIEYFANKSFKYPSYYLLHNENRKLKDYLKSYFLDEFQIEKYRIVRISNSYKIKIVQERKGYGKLLWRIIIFIGIFPITSFFFTLGTLTGVNKFIVRPLDGYIINGIKTKLNNLTTRLGIEKPDVNSNADLHRIVMHYVFLNITNSQKKTENYVAIYGFLRAISLICCIYTDVIIYKGIMTIDFSMPIDWGAIFVISVMIAVCNILFMGFIKFYRRFTLENYMALLTEKTQG